MDDYISRQAAIKALSIYIHNVDRVIGTGKLSPHDCDDAARSVLDELPSADVQLQPVQHGHWISHPDDLFPEDSMIECSVCHEYEYATANDNFCGNCGAKMDGEQNDTI